MGIELAAQIWKETKSFIDNYDKTEASEALVVVLMENFDVDEIASTFKFDKHVMQTIKEYIVEDDLAEEEEYYDDDDDFE